MHLLKKARLCETDKVNSIIKQNDTNSICFCSVHFFHVGRARKSSQNFYSKKCDNIISDKLLLHLLLQEYIYVMDLSTKITKIVDNTRKRRFSHLFGQQLGHSTTTASSFLLPGEYRFDIFKWLS
jgi:hypothetical protein